MKCLMDNCNHHIRRGINSNKALSESWKLFGICVCCANELSKHGVINQYFPNSSVCSKALRLESTYNSKNGPTELKYMTIDRSPLNQITIYA